jgi:hypothetical protein
VSQLAGGKCAKHDGDPMEGDLGVDGRRIRCSCSAASFTFESFGALRKKRRERRAPRCCGHSGREARGPCVCAIQFFDGVAMALPRRATAEYGCLAKSPPLRQWRPPHAFCGFARKSRRTRGGASLAMRRSRPCRRSRRPYTRDEPEAKVLVRPDQRARPRDPPLWSPMTGRRTRSRYSETRARWHFRVAAAPASRDRPFRHGGPTCRGWGAARPRPLRRPWEGLPPLPWTECLPRAHRDR